MRQKPTRSTVSNRHHTLAFTDVLVRPTAAVDLTTPTCRLLYELGYARTIFYITQMGSYDLPDTSKDPTFYGVFEVNRRVICTLSEFIIPYSSVG